MPEGAAIFLDMENFPLEVSLLFSTVPALALELFITITVAESFFRWMPVLSFCILKLSCIRLPTQKDIMVKE